MTSHPVGNKVTTRRVRLPGNRQRSRSRRFPLRTCVCLPQCVRSVRVPLSVARSMHRTRHPAFRTRMSPPLSVFSNISVQDYTIGEAENPGPDNRGGGSQTQGDLSVLSVNETSIRYRWQNFREWGASVVACQEARLGKAAQKEITSDMKEKGLQCVHSGPSP